jgi:hypothetical protein
MNPERFRQIRNLFDAAVERPTGVRPAFLQEACQGDADLRDSVSRLLDAHQQTAGVLDQPPLLRGDTGRMEGRRRAETDAILRKQLSEWPGGTVLNPESEATQ